ncbi:MAG: serine/threonine protein kinase, partial [Bacteroidales bacterium]|nr:serine/threonine protein kinase [Bacteroidales bacterium]
MSSSVDPKQPPVNRTVVLRTNRTAPPETHNTDYDLSLPTQTPSATLQVAEPALPLSVAEPAVTFRKPGHLDAETRALFHQRLRLCCLIAAGPFGFFVACSGTNFIQLLSRDTVGWTGFGLALFTLSSLAGAAGFLFRRQTLDEKWLRVLELAIFGIMATCIAYWEFAVLTGTPGLVDAEYLTMPSMTEQVYVLAAALFVHFCWFVLIVFHGVLVPNTLARGVGVAFGMCVAAVAISVIVVFTHPATGRNAGVLFAVSTTMLGAAVGLSVFGTAKTEELREEVRTAREAMRELGQYRLRRKLGQGGMGEVYLAEHRLLKRPCALKRIHPRFVHNADQLKRFEREVQATAGLRHPNTVEIYDYGRADDGTFFYVMEFVPGMNLEEIVLKYGPMPPDRVVYILRQICGALREAHRHALVHRDIKPSNILVVSNGHPHDLAKLVDFGLVHTINTDMESESQQHKLTRDGLIVGTPEYMSPEQ